MSKNNQIFFNAFLLLLYSILNCNIDTFVNSVIVDIIKIVLFIKPVKICIYWWNASVDKFYIMHFFLCVNSFKQ